MGAVMIGRTADEQRVRVAQTRLMILIDEYQRQHALSDLQTLQALAEWQSIALSCLVRKQQDA